MSLDENFVSFASVLVIPSILVVDRELGFMFALSQALRKRRIAAIPACSVAEAETLIADLRPELAVLVINCSCPGVCAFAMELRQRLSQLQVVGITYPGRQCRQCAPVLAATLKHPEDRRPDRIEHCAELVSSLIKKAHAYQ